MKLISVYIYESIAFGLAYEKTVSKVWLQFLQLIAILAINVKMFEIVCLYFFYLPVVKCTNNFTVEIHSSCLPGTGTISILRLFLLLSRFDKWNVIHPTEDDVPN